MNIKLGTKIKELRKAKNISQEILAEYLGVSFQAVSKWENEAGLPDVTLIPAIASFFEVSTDELLDYNRMENEKKRDAICDEAAKCRNVDPAKAEQILRDGLKQFPGDDIILNNLLYTMRSPERSEEVIKLCKTLIECTHYDDVKYDALRILAETYHETGQQALVEPTLEAIPEIYFTKLELMGQLLEGEKSFKAAKDQLSINLDSSVEMIQIMKGYLTEKGNDAEVKKCEEMQHRITEMLEE
ncbi:MAG: helix-turn-helix transcriptional regulator [Agathobacter sp.]|nr:helix-turn-helix transcriptional regulator [Agathobacter sp.]